MNISQVDFELTSNIYKSIKLINLDKIEKKNDE